MERARSTASILKLIFYFIIASLLAGLVVGLMTVPFVGGAGVLARETFNGFNTLGIDDQFEDPELSLRSQIYASDGQTLIAEVFYENRTEVELENVSPYMRSAIVAIEDERFLEHNGVDVRGVGRALLANLDAGALREGSSTITMQLIKNSRMANAETADELEAATETSFDRKISEARAAIDLEKRLSKGEILERYLNIAYFGSGSYGVEAAARRYFSKPASDLTIAEAATLAGIVKSPTANSPLADPQRSQDRRDVVLKRMLDQGYISQAEYDEAVSTNVEDYLKPRKPSASCVTSWASYFCEYVIETILTDPAFGETRAQREILLRRGGLRITTTLDADSQRQAQKIVNVYIPPKDRSKKAAAISVVEPATGNIMVMAQNRTWGTSGRGKTTYNYNTDQSMGGTIGMQAGSTFKVFTLAAALEAGISPLERINSPQTATFREFVNCDTGEPFEEFQVNNSTQGGYLTMGQATAYSTNTYFMAIEERTGICRPAEIAEQMGVRLGDGGDLPRVPTFTLGTAEVTPLSMAGAYAGFANHGNYCEPRSIIEIRDRRGDKIGIPPVNCNQVVERRVADAVTEMLAGVIDGPIGGRTGSAMSLGDQPAAGKTGTTNDSAAVWFAGYTPQAAAAVWVGDPRGGFAYPMKDITINGTYYRQVFGGTLPGPIWRDTMQVVLEDKPRTDFDLIPWVDESNPFSGTPLVFDEVETPDLTELETAEDILASIEDSDLVLGLVTEQDSASPAGTVLSQSIEAGTVADPGTTVDLVVASGYNTVPESRGAPQGDATTILQRAGMNVTVVNVEDSNSPAGVVVSQSVGAGARLPVGTNVVIGVAVPAPEPEPGPTPEPPPAPEPEPTPEPPPPAPEPEPTPES